MPVFHADNFNRYCDKLASRDKTFQKIITAFGYPPLWTRPNTYASLIHIILEQQVSLASAKAAFVKLKNHIGVITPQKLLKLSDAELKICYFSRQKIIYSRQLAEAIVSKQLQLKQLELLPEEDVGGTVYHGRRSVQPDNPTRDTVVACPESSGARR